MGHWLIVAWKKPHKLRKHIRYNTKMGVDNYLSTIKGFLNGFVSTGHRFTSLYWALIHRRSCQRHAAAFLVGYTLEVSLALVYKPCRAEALAIMFRVSSSISAASSSSPPGPHPAPQHNTLGQKTDSPAVIVARCLQELINGKHFVDSEN